MSSHDGSCFLCFLDNITRDVCAQSANIDPFAHDLRLTAVLVKHW